MHRTTVAQNPELLKEVIRGLVLGAGFTACRFLVPFRPLHAPEQYRGGAASLVVAALAHGAGTGAENIAPFAQRNYYRAAVRRLQGVAAELRSGVGGEKREYRILCNSRVAEKPLAVACGLGWGGRNSLVITPEAGSRAILAAMTLPFSLRGDAPLPNHPCRECDSARSPCAAACPTGAVGDGAIDLSRCIQWYASGNGRTVPAEVARQWGNRLYGCTACQDACVQNRGSQTGVLVEDGVLPAYIDPKELLGMSDDAIKQRFRGTTLGLAWLGPEALKRNARLSLGRGV